MNSAVSAVVTIATAVVGVAILAVIVSRNAQTPQVIREASRGFSDILRAATGPVSGNQGWTQPF